MREGGDVTLDCFTSDLLLRLIHDVKRHKSCLPCNNGWELSEFRGKQEIKVYKNWPTLAKKNHLKVLK